jgi:hypothetical protein
VDTTEIIATTISPNYVAGWGATEALREIIQNYLDVVDMLREQNTRAGTRKPVKGQIAWSNGEATISDRGPGLELRHFALGISEKDSPYSRGQFGEGLKLAIMVLARSGRGCTILSNGRKITPVIREHSQLGTPTLHLVIEKSRKRSGTEIVVQCSEEEYQSAREKFVELDEGISWLDHSAGISLPAGRIYVNGTLVGRHNALFSYHFTHANADSLMNRDRSIVDMSKVMPLVTEAVASTTSNIVITEFLRKWSSGPSESDEDVPLELIRTPYWYEIPAKNYSLWTKATRSLLGNAIIASGNADLDQLAVHLGHKVIDVVDPSFRSFLSNVCKFDSVQDVLQSRRIVAEISVLSDREISMLDTATRIVTRLYRRPNEVCVCDSIVIASPNSDIIEGLCVQDDDVSIYAGKILLNKSIFDTLQHVVEVLLHETIHQYSRCADRTYDFEYEYTKVAGHLAILAATDMIGEKE